MATQALTDAQISARLKTLEGWNREGDTLVKSFKLPTYAAGLVFATTVGAIAEGHDHHPDMTIGYKTVKVVFSTHDAGNKISQKDLDSAAAINALPYPKK